MFQITAIIGFFIVCGASAQSFCGEKEAVENKTCISVRLPWQLDPIYFCTEMENVKYRDHCDRFSRYCPTDTSTNTLQIATPWDCCALTSTPDHCADRTCAPAPFNRTCKEIAPDSRHRWDCCPTYFCEEGPINNCQMKRLQPGCLNPPKDKANCTGFKDEHGCCNKYQCADEGKPGMCPMEAQAMNFKRMMENTTAMSHNQTQSLSLTSNKFMSNSHHSHHNHYGLIKTDLRCTGDYTCPGQMKCCSTRMSSYYDVNKVETHYNKHSKKSNSAIYGYCMEPVSVSV